MKTAIKKTKVYRFNELSETAKAEAMIEHLIHILERQTHVNRIDDVKEAIGERNFIEMQAYLQDHGCTPKIDYFHFTEEGKHYSP